MSSVHTHLSCLDFLACCIAAGVSIAFATRRLLPGDLLKTLIIVPKATLVLHLLLLRSFVLPTAHDAPLIAPLDRNSGGEGSQSTFDAASLGAAKLQPRLRQIANLPFTYFFGGQKTTFNASLFFSQLRRTIPKRGYQSDAGDLCRRERAEKKEGKEDDNSTNSPP